MQPRVVPRARRAALAGLAGVALLAGAVGPAVAQTPTPRPYRVITELPGGAKPAGVDHQNDPAIAAHLAGLPKHPAPAPTPSASEARMLEAMRRGEPAPAEPTVAPVSRFDATKGQRFRFGTKEVQLPPDAGVVGSLRASYAYARTADGTLALANAQGTPQPGAAAPETDFWVVRRGAAEAHVGVRSGKLAGVAPPERAADFAWLAEALR